MSWFCRSRGPKYNLCKATNGLPGNLVFSNRFNSKTVESEDIVSFFFLSRKLVPYEVDTCTCKSLCFVATCSSELAPPRNQRLLGYFTQAASVQHITHTRSTKRPESTMAAEKCVQLSILLKRRSGHLDPSARLEHGTHTKRKSLLYPL